MYILVGGITFLAYIGILIFWGILELIYWSYYYINDKDYCGSFLRKYLKPSTVNDLIDSELIMASMVFVLLGAAVWPLFYIFIIGCIIINKLRYVMRRKNKNKKIIKGELSVNNTNYGKAMSLKKEYEDLKDQLAKIKSKMLDVKKKAKEELNWIMNDNIEE